MSLFSAIQKSANALQVAELGLHVVGNNVANAGTPGYIRQELLQSSGPAVRIGPVILGAGVRAVGVVQKLDEFLVERMREIRSDLESSDRMSQLYGNLESIFNEMNDNDLSSRLNDFSISIQDLLNQPGNEALRRLVIERGRVLTEDIRSIDQQMKSFNSLLNSETQQTAEEINRLSAKIATLNQRIVEMEGGKASRTSDAVGLRDERLTALEELSAYVDIRTVEQESGAVSVFLGGDYLVADGLYRQVAVALKTEEGENFPEVRFVDTDSPLEVSGGRLHGIYSARNSVIRGFGVSLDQFARTVIHQFNRVHSQGQGAVGFAEATAATTTDDPSGPLDLAGFGAKLENGDFQILVKDLGTGLVTTSTIRVKLTGAPDDSSLEDVAAQLNAVSGVNASVTNDGRLRIVSDSNQLKFSFQNDTSGLLAATGINTFFVGNSAATIAINPIVANDPRMLAASLTGIGYGTDNAVQLARAFEDPIESLEGRSIKESYEDMVVRLIQDINLQKGKSDGLRNFYNTLEAQHLANSGVNMDEEAIKMIFYQRVFQANSKLIQTSSEILETLVNL